MGKVGCHFLIVIGAAISAYAGPVLADCNTVVGIIDPDIRQRVVGALQSQRLQLLAKKAADGLEQEPVTDSDIANPSSGLRRIMEKFRAALRTEVVGTIPNAESGLALSWIENMTEPQLLSCFPDMVVSFQAFVRRGDEAQQAAKQRQGEEAARAKLPVNVLATAYAAYIDIKRCHEAREGYLAGYISDPEMAQAKSAVRQIEEAVKPKLDSNTRAEDVWSRVEQTEGHNFYPSRDYQEGARMLCRRRLSLLLQSLHDKVPNSDRIEKDF